MNLTGMIRNASNIYFPSIYSSLHLPLADTRPIERVIEFLSTPPLCDLLNEAPGLSAATLRRNSPSLAAFSDDEIQEALETLRQLDTREAQTTSISDSVDKTELHYREEEHLELSKQQNSEYLVVQHQDMDKYGDAIKGLFKSVALVPTLRETRVQAGFSRIVDSGPSSGSQKMLWRSFPPNSYQRWLPANRVFGEGLFFQLEEPAVAEWERQGFAQERVIRLGRDLSMPVHSIEMNVGIATALLPRLLLVHSFAHALMREFVVTCGYSAPSLRERLYVSKSKTRPMASLLIYTASGDSSGSLGGLVRLGEPETLESLIRRAMQRAMWCATDPVCFEAVPETTTSTRELANLAACHNCMFVPETSCEEFNGLLDRAMLVGTYDEPSLGYFSALTN